MATQREGALEVNSKIKVAIVEEHLDAQEIIATFIEPLESFEVVGFADNGESLLDLNSKQTPDIIIADIQMLKLNGIEVIAACLVVTPHLKFIFTSSYREYAVNAFDLNAVDYVMKPIKKERLYIALEKAKRTIQKQNLIGKKKILTLQINRDSHFIHFSKIIYIEKANRKTIVHTLEKKYETNESLDSLSKRLNNDFFRTHRAFIVNLYYISQITTEGEGYLAYLEDHPHFVHISKLRIKELYKEISFISEE